MGFLKQFVLSMFSTFLGRFRGWAYSRKMKAGNPIRFCMPRNIFITLYPQGQIVELLYVSHFEKNEIGLVVDYLKPGMNVVDVGANVGLYSILAGLRVGNSGKVFAFEPSAESHKRLLANITLNQVANIEVIKMALADTTNVNLFLKRDPGYRDGDRYLETRQVENRPAPPNPQDYGDSERVSVTTLDQYFYTDKREGVRVDFLKMDVEGGEFAVLRGARRLLAENNEILLMFECTVQCCSCAGHTQDDVFSYLKELGFGLYAWDTMYDIWKTDLSYLKLAGNIWACRDHTRLPFSQAI